MLFRADALRHALQDHTEGRVLLRSPAIVWGCTLACVACASSLAILLWTAHYTPQLRLDGRMLDAHSAQLRAHADASALLPAGTRVTLRFSTARGASVDATVHGPAGADPHAVLLMVAPHPLNRAHALVEADLALPPVRLRDWIWRKKTQAAAQ